MGPCSNADDQRMPVLHHLHRWLFLIHMDLPNEEEEWSALPLPKAQKPSGERNRLAHSMLVSRMRKGVLLWRIHLLPPRWRHTKRILVLVHTATKWSCRKEESANTQGSTRHWEAHDKLLLGRSCIHNRLSHESMHHKLSAWANSIRDPCWKKVDPTTPQSVQKHCICTHPEWKTTKARRKVREMYHFRILIQAKGIQVLQQFNLSGSSKSRRSLRRIDIMVWTRFNSIRPNWGRVGCQYGWWHSAKSFTKVQSTSLPN
mgnify:CR=1 FL=1